MSRMIPFREAARLMGVSEESLRRQILLGEIPATPVDDDRQYLLGWKEGTPRRPPPPSIVRLLAWSALAWLALGTLMFLGSSTTQDHCVRCPSVRFCERFLGVPVESFAAEGAWDCDHEWRIGLSRPFRNELLEILRRASSGANQ